LKHWIFRNSARPESAAAWPPPGSLPKLKAVGAVAKAAEKLFTYRSTAARSSLESVAFHAGMLVPPIPSSTTCRRSASVGSSPVAVVRTW
jgi:hypothetical protein